MIGLQKYFAVAVPVPAATIGTDFTLFTAPFDCVLMSVNETHATAGSDGSAVNLQLTHDDSTDAPGAGDDLLSNNSNAGFNLKGTANTVQYGSFKSGVSRKFVRGDRLCADWAGTTTAVAGVTITAIFNKLD